MTQSSQPGDVSGHHVGGIVYRISPAVENNDLNALFADAWPEHSERDFQPILSRSLAYVCAYQGPRLVGFVNIAWDGGIHGFVLDTTVHPKLQRRGIGRQLVRYAAAAARKRGIEWLHADYELHLEGFYRSCGFSPTAAGLVHLQGEEP